MNVIAMTTSFRDYFCVDFSEVTNGFPHYSHIMLLNCICYP